jgi:hypothetical protein
MMFNDRWGMTVFKCFAAFLRSHPYPSFLISMEPTHFMLTSCLSFLTGDWGGGCSSFCYGYALEVTPPQLPFGITVHAGRMHLREAYKAQTYICGMNFVKGHFLISRHNK